MLSLGLLDDRFALKPLPKLLGLSLAAALPTPFLLTKFSYLECLSLAAALLFFSNAFNFLDNSDGQCASVAAAAFAAAALHSPEPARLAVLGALLGFLWWNRPPARIFLGDAGSLLIGAWSVLLILRDQQRPGFIVDSRLLPLFWLPLYDSLSVITLRLWQRRPPWHGGQDHFAWRIMRRGLSPSATISLLALLTFLPGLITLWLPLSGWLLTLTLISLAATVEFTFISASPR
ncbi:MAG: hypothetical protein N2595_08515 [bacterium]|nr:hypothetical protein [bacterium]